MAKDEEKIDWKKELPKYQVKDTDLWPVKYYIQVNTPFQSLAKYYLMVLDELKNMGHFPKIEKINQSLAASPTSGFFADVAQRKAYAKEQIDKSMQIIGGVIQTVTKLIYSLREFDMILHIFDDLNSEDRVRSFAAEQNLRRIFLDEVDIKKGRGSVHQMATTGGLEFVSLRDAFMVSMDLASVDSLTLNDRVKRIIKDRLNEYVHWRKEYEKDIRGRKKIEMQYLKAQAESLKMQAEWVKPYYSMLKQLDISTGETNPELISGFDTSVITAKVRALAGGKFEEIRKLATGFVEVDFIFRTKPVQTRTEQGQSFQHLLRIDVTYTPYVMPNDVYEKLIKQETSDDINFLKNIVGDSLNAIKDDLDKYLKGGEIREAESHPSEPKPFEFLLYPFEPIFGMFKPLFKPAEKKDEGEPEFHIHKLQNDMKNLQKDMRGRAFDCYENFKDENGWMTWSGPLSEKLS